MKVKTHSYTYTWNRADNLSNFGKGIVYKNYLDQNLNNFEKLKEEKNQFKPFIFPMWNKFSINIINSLYLKLNKLTKIRKK